MVKLTLSNDVKLRENLVSEEDLPPITVIIVNFNMREELIKCIKSLLSLDYPQEKLKILVIDNGSTDGSVETLEKLYKGVIQIIRLKYNVGFARAVKLAIKASTTNWVLLLNPDVRLPSYYLRKLMTVLLTYPNMNRCWAISGTILSGNGKLILSQGAMFDPITGYDWHLNWKKKIDEAKNSIINKVYYVPLAAAVVKRDVLQQLDENLFLYNEDLDLALSLISENYFCVVVTKEFAFHNIELRRRPQYTFRVYHHVRGRLYILYKHLHKCFLRTNLEIISSCDSVNLVVRGYDN
jgi:GT2 family glycosyltransferase